MVLINRSKFIRYCDWPSINIHAKCSGQTESFVVSESRSHVCPLISFINPFLIPPNFRLFNADINSALSLRRLSILTSQWGSVCWFLRLSSTHHVICSYVFIIENHYGFFIRISISARIWFTESICSSKLVGTHCSIVASLTSSNVLFKNLFSNWVGSFLINPNRSLIAGKVA